MSQFETLSGCVQDVIFENVEDSFYILRILLDRSETEDLFNVSLMSPVVVVKGVITGLQIRKGVWFAFEGRWVVHEQHGQQIEILKAPLSVEWSPSRAISVLRTEGVGELHLDLILKHIGEDKFIASLSDPDLLSGVPGLTLFDALMVASKWNHVRMHFQVIDFLNKIPLARNKIEAVWKTFGDDCEEVVSNNPWALTRVPGIGFRTADEVAREMGMAMDSPLRVEGAVLYFARQRRAGGHLYLSLTELMAEIDIELPSIDHSQVAEALKALHKRKEIWIDNKTNPSVFAIYNPWFYQIEKGSAEYLASRMRTASFDHDDGRASLYSKTLGSFGVKSEGQYKATPGDIRGVARAAIEDWSMGHNINLSEQQRQGVLQALVEPVSILTGLPGSGKTTSLKAVVSILTDIGVTVLLVAPTGIAAKRLSTVSGSPASTIHRAFRAQGFRDTDERKKTYGGISGSKGDSSVSGDTSEEELWDFSQSNPYPADVVIVDESSMVDANVLYRILDCTAPTCRIVFVGDAAQLPSVGPGNVLRDLISCQKFPMVFLDRVYRQEDTSAIVMAAHAIHAGRVPDVMDIKSDFTFIECEDEAKILNLILSFARKLYDQRRNFQVISPKHGDLLGVTNLNAELRTLLNPKVSDLKECRFGNDTIREGDRVMVVRNDYESDVYNGDVGKIDAINTQGRVVTVKLHATGVDMGRKFNYDFRTAANNLRLAYAATVHKVQGQEFDVVVMPMVRTFGFQLQRNLLYTAITRARKKVILVGHLKALHRAIENNWVDSRNTLFKERLDLAFKGI